MPIFGSYRIVLTACRTSRPSISARFHYGYGRTGGNLSNDCSPSFGGGFTSATEASLQRDYLMISTSNTQAFRSPTTRVRTIPAANQYSPFEDAVSINTLAMSKGTVAT